MTKHTKPVLFCDFDGTICHDRYWRSVPPVLHNRIQKLLFDADRTMVHDWMRGTYRAEDINRYLAEKLNVPYEELWNIFVKDCQTMHVDQAVLSRLAALRNDFWTVLITGNMDSFSRFTVPALGLERYFDRISNSYYETKHKTDDNGALFAEYCQTFAAPIRSSILIDDSPYVCQIFVALGGTAWPITSEKDILYYLDRLTV